MFWFDNWGNKEGFSLPLNCSSLGVSWATKRGHPSESEFFSEVNWKWTGRGDQ